MEAKQGITELKEVVDFAIDAMGAVKEIAADGKLGLSDIGAVIKLAKMASPAIQGIDKVPAELKDLSPEEATQLVAHVVAKLAVDDARATKIAEASLKLAIAGYELAKAISEKPAV